MPKFVTTGNMDEYVRGNTIELPKDAVMTHSAIDAAKSRGLKMVTVADDEKDIIASVTEVVAERLKARGISPTAEDIKAIVPKVLSVVNEQGYSVCSKAGSESHAILTAFGRDSVGVVAAIAAVLSEHRVSILDMNQRILQEFFSLNMILDISKADCDFETLREHLDAVAASKAIRIATQLETIFRYMHRV